MTLQCGINYTWGPNDSPVCRPVKCPLPPDIKKGYYLVDNSASDSISIQNNSFREFHFEDIITYECNAGHKFTGYNQTVRSYPATCSATVSWETIPPDCEPVSCGIPPQRHHGKLLPTFVNQTFVFADVVSYTCDKGYESKETSDNETLTCTENG